MILVILIIIKTIKFIIQIIIFLIYVHGWFGFVYKIDMGVGVIDADYRGRKNCAVDSWENCNSDVMEVEDLDATERGVGGFGSTGLWASCDL